MGWLGLWAEVWKTEGGAWEMLMNARCLQYVKHEEGSLEQRITAFAKPLHSCCTGGCCLPIMHLVCLLTTRLRPYDLHIVYVTSHVDRKQDIDRT